VFEADLSWRAPFAARDLKKNPTNLSFHSFSTTNAFGERGCCRQPHPRFISFEAQKKIVQKPFFLERLAEAGTNRTP
jgi:hypothetical protein